MSQHNDGGPAFPVTPTDRGGQCAPTEYGMTLRDYFAAKAMQGLLASPHADPRGGATVLAESAYIVADAMIAAREGR
jgi:hypothetical protein